MSELENILVFKNLHILNESVHYKKKNVHNFANYKKK